MHRVVVKSNRPAAGSMAYLVQEWRVATAKQPLLKALPWVALLVPACAFVGATLTSTSGRAAAGQVLGSDAAAWASAVGTFAAAVVAVYLGVKAERTTLALEQRRENERETERRERSQVLAASLIPVLAVVSGTAEGAKIDLEETIHTYWGTPAVDLEKARQIAVQGLGILEDRLPDMHHIMYLGADLADLYSQCVTVNATIANLSVSKNVEIIDQIGDHLTGLARQARSISAALVRVHAGIPETIDYEAVRQASPMFGKDGELRR